MLENNLFQFLDGSVITAWRDSHRNTLLHKVARKGNKADLEYLLSKKYCDLEIPNLRGETALLVAKYSRPDIVRLLLKHGAKVRVVNNQGQSPLHLAVLAKNVMSVKLVLDAGADVKLVDRQDRSALCTAVETNSIDIAELLLERGADPNQKFERARSVLSIATRAQNELMIRLLIRYGADVAHINPDGSCPLHYAMRLTDTTISRMMIQLGANVNQKGSDHFAVIHEAIYKDNLDQVKLLVEFNADIFIRTSDGITPLHWAAHCNNSGCQEMIRYLVGKGANVNDPDHTGNTCLHFAAKNCSLEVFKMLLEFGADLSLRNQRGDTMLHCAAGNDDTEIMRMVLQLTKLKPDVVNDIGNTPLHYAAESGSTEGCAFLLGEGASVNSRSSLDNTPLFLAILARETETIKFLLRRDAGANECLTNAIGEDGYDEINHILVRHLAKLSLSDGIDFGDFEYMYEDEGLRDLFEQCETELESMKSYKIYEEVTILDIVTADVKKLGGYARNEELVNALTDKNDPVKFPLYYEDVEVRLMEEWMRQNVVRDAATVLNDIFKFNDVRHVALERIVSFLNFHDLTVLASVIERASS